MFAKRPSRILNSSLQSGHEVSSDIGTELPGASGCNRGGGVVGRRLVVSKRTHVAPNLREEEEGRQTEREGDVLSQFVTGRASAANERTSLPPIVASTSSSSCIICDSNLEMYHLAPLILTNAYCVLLPPVFMPAQSLASSSAPQTTFTPSRLPLRVAG